MAQDAIHLLFDVEGGEKLTEGSGAEILRQLSGIVNEINRGDHLPKIRVEFDADEAITELRRQLDGLSTSGSHPLFGGIGEQLKEIAKNTKPLEDLSTIFYGVIRAIGQTQEKLNDIFEAIPDGMEGSESSIKKVTAGVQGLVEQIGNLSEVVEEISKKPSSVVNHIVGDGHTEDIAKLELLKNQARELMNTFQELYGTFDSNYGSGTNSSLDRVFGEKYKNLAAKQDAYQALSDANRNLLSVRTSVDAATESKDVSKVIALYNRLNKEMYSLIATANRSGSVELPLPDLAKLQATGRAIKEYEEAKSKALSEPTVPAEGQSVLDTAKTINEALHSIEEVLTSVRSKIESTFDLSTVDMKMEGLKAKLEELATISAKIKKVSEPKEISKSRDVSEALSEAEKIAKQEAEMWEQHLKKRWDKTQAQIDREIQAAYKAHEQEERELDELGKKQMREYDEKIARARKAEKEVQNAQKKSEAESRKRDESAQKEKSNRIKSLINEYYRLQKELEKAATRDGGISGGKGYLDEKKTNEVYRHRIQLLKAIKEQLDGIELSAPIKPDDDSDQLPIGFSVNTVEVKEGAKELGISAAQYKSILEDIQKKSRELSAEHEKNMNASDDQWDRNRDKALRYLEDLKDRGADSHGSVRTLMQDVEGLARNGDASNLNELKTSMKELRDEVTRSGADIETWGHKLSKTLGGKIRGAMAGAVLAQLTKFTHDVYTNVVNLNKSLVDLQIATGKNKESVEDLIRTYSKLGKQLGATTQEVAAAADTWLRQGYSINETNELLKNTMMLSKLGQIESAEAATALTSSMKGYNVETERSIDVVDKLTAVDMEAAASAGGIAVAMAETATGARIAGISMDTLIGYIATVKEVTQDADESVGTFYRTLFARMNNVAAGRFIDDETGESLNDVETVLRKVGIALRDVDGQFRSSGAVIDEVGKRWKEFNTVEQHAIATAMAGGRQQEKLIALMENYGDAVRYAEVATESSGTANEKYGAYLEGIEGKADSLKAAIEDLSLSILDSDLIIGGLSILTGIIGGVTTLTNKLGGVQGALVAIIGVVATIKANDISHFIRKSEVSVKLFARSLKKIKKDFVSARNEGKSMGAAVSSALGKMKDSAIATKIAVGAVMAALTIAVTVYSAVRQAQEDRIRLSVEAAQASLQEAEAAHETAEGLDTVIKKYKELADNSGGTWNNESLQTVRGLQDEIVSLVDEQAKGIDLVNGKLDTEIEKLRKLANEERERARVEATASLADAEVALKGRMKANRTELLASNRYFALMPEASGESYGNIEVGETTNAGYSLSGAVAYDTIRTQYDSVEEFARQYEAVQEYKQSIAQEVRDGTKPEKLWNEINDFLDYYSEEYNAYIAAAKKLEALSEVPVADKVDPLIGNTAELKTSLQILNEIQKGYDGLSKALADATAEGYITAETFATLCELEEEGALAGLKLEDVLVRNANGYKIQADSLKKYVEVLIQQYTIESQYAGTDDKRNAIANLENLRTVLGMLMLTQEDVNDATEAYREELEAQQDALDDQLDRFGELIDIRKDLLQTYQDEVEYQRELEKRQRNVSQLQTKLSVARLDTSAAGQARVRELEAELKEAQEDLEDYTLEHAIDVLTNRLDSQYAEYEAFIKGKLDEITALLDQIEKGSEEPEDNGMSWLKDALLEISSAIQEAKKPDEGASNVHVPNSDASEDLSKDIVATPFGETADETPSTPSTKNEKSNVEKTPGNKNTAWISPSGDIVGATAFGGETASAKPSTHRREVLEYGGDYQVSGLNSGLTLGKDDISVSIKGQTYDVKISNIEQPAAAANTLNKLYGGSMPKQGSIAVYGNIAYIVKKGSWRQLVEEDADALVRAYKGELSTYHSGGFVGGLPRLAYNEEFAKLLEGELVSTPTQMKRFMEETLPGIANYTAPGEKNEFNAPLIEIHCDTVTSEAMPKMERVVNEAVQEIQRQLDSGMSRAGFKRQPTKRLV